MNGTTVGMILTSNMTEIGTKFTLIYNDTDNVNPFLQRHFLIDKIVVFEDNKLNTQSSSYEFMLSGSIIWAVGTLWPTMYFLITGAFHTSNNTFDVYKRVYLNNVSDPLFGDNYRYNVTNMNSNPVVYFD